MKKDYQQLHLVQRMRKINAGHQLEVLSIIEDPVMFTAPWQFVRTYEFRPDIEIMEYPCGEEHRYLSGDHVLGQRLNWKAK